ncbi:PucR family transcriptional regulator [Amycolatopsis benzoatilytica]|uniref:PucR family transcriptional regulator n=1 Tax=Amycolatopsis benzoatilytica TaxID=346045 RepID=UPI0003706533|nr:helix-turn-helix domain-containing protein [Amycolatopsis benzoatilytica]
MADRDGDALQTLVDDLADELQRSVAVNDPVVRVLCTSRHFGDEDEIRIRAVLQHDAGAAASSFILGQGVAQWPRPGMLDGDAELGMSPRFCVPLRERGDLLGLLMVIDADHSLTESETARIEQVSKTAAALLHQARIAADGVRGERERTLSRLLGPEPDARRDALTADWLSDAPQVVVTVLEARPGELSAAETEVAVRSVVESAARRRPRRLLPLVAGIRGVLVHPAPHIDQNEIARDAERMAGELSQLLGGQGTAVAGIGEPADGLASAWQSYAQAAAAAKGARLLPGAGPVAQWADLGAYAILLQIPDDALSPALIPEPLARLRADPKGPRLVETLRTFLDHGGSIPRTAEALHLHRTSLYYRLDQIRAISGLDLDDGRTRLLLHAGLLVADLVTGG